MRFDKGRSGNPGGRPKGDGEIRELARQHTSIALATLVEICQGILLPGVARRSGAEKSLARL
jgi:hypothetical protein